MTQDIHEIIARAEQRPGHSLSIDPPEYPDSTDIGCTHCDDRNEDHFTIDLGDAGTLAVCKGNLNEIRDAIVGNEWAYEEDYPESEDDGPDPDKARDEAIDRMFDPPDRYE